MDVSLPRFPAQEPARDRLTPFNPSLEGVIAAVATACGVPEPRPPSRPVDWSEFLSLVDHHRVAPLVHRSGWLERAGAPAEVHSTLEERSRRNALDSLRLLALQREVFDALEGSEVRGISLKGAAAALDGYGDLTARDTGDLDILVSPQSVPAAIRALQSAGLSWYGWDDPDDPDRTPVGPADIPRLSRLPLLRDVALGREGLRVELHWRLFRNERLMPVDPDWLTGPRRVEVGGKDVLTLPLTAEWRYLLVHGSAHLWRRMKWLADVPAIALRRPEVAQHSALEHAAEGGYSRSLATGLIVAEATFGRFLTPESRSWAWSVRGTGTLVRRSSGALAAGHVPRQRVSPRALPGHVHRRFALRRDARYRLNELQILLLEAGRAQGVEDPGLGDLAAGPLRWIRRSARRLANRA